MSLFQDEYNVNHADEYAIDPTGLVLDANGNQVGETVVDPSYYNALNPDLSATLVSPPTNSGSSNNLGWLQGLSSVLTSAGQLINKPVVAQPRPGYVYSNGQYLPVKPATSNGTIYLIIGIVVVMVSMLIIFIARRK